MVNWDEKYLKDAPWFPFGTLVGGWARIKANDPNYTMAKYQKDTEKLFKQARGMVKQNLIDVQAFFRTAKTKTEEPDIDET